SSMAWTTHNELWVGPFSGGAVKYDGRTWTKFNQLPEPAFDSIEAIVEAKDGAIWFFKERTGIMRFGPLLQ
ncbi:MAG: hypothetical protein WBM17_03475, partial [Anaerolineales bacterium]